MLSNIPNGPVTNGVMTLAVTSEGGSVTNHGFDERLSPHVTPDSVTSCVTPDTNGPTPLNAYENGHDTQEHYNDNSSTVMGPAADEKSMEADEAPPPKQELSEETTVTTKEDEHTQQEEAPERQNTDGVPVDSETDTGVPAEEKEAIVLNREEVKQPPDVDKGEWIHCVVDTCIFAKITPYKPVKHAHHYILDTMQNKVSPENLICTCIHLHGIANGWEIFFVKRFLYLLYCQPPS